MAIEPISGPGVQRANLVCDSCGRSETIACGYDKIGFRKWQPSRGQALSKAKGKGWAEVKGDLHCPTCEAKRKAAAPKKPARIDPPLWFDTKAALADIQKSAKPKGQPEMTTAAKAPDVRKPTPKQERLIILALEDAYDDQNKRYKGAATDKTLAEELGDGIMFGWVAEVRERLFGPSGGNEEIEAIRAEISSIAADLDAKVKALGKRLDAVTVAVGPRAQRVA